MISFSTCWNSRRHTSGDAMLREIKTTLGFDLIELDHGIRMPLMQGIQKMFDTREISFSSLHNFCPLPADAAATSSDCYKFSGASAEERDAAITQTFQAIDFAARLDASFVVLHLGQINMPPITDQLIAMAKAGEYLSRNYVRMKIGAVQEREKIAPECLERVKNCLRRIIEYAASKNVRIGLEARRNYEQIPTERELA
jgi:sugar phosphate isomerase/epimerase